MRAGRSTGCSGSPLPALPVHPLRYQSTANCTMPHVLTTCTQLPATHDRLTPNYRPLPHTHLPATAPHLTTCHCLTPSYLPLPHTLLTCHCMCMCPHTLLPATAVSHCQCLTCELTPRCLLLPQASSRSPPKTPTASTLSSSNSRSRSSTRHRATTTHPPPLPAPHRTCMAPGGSQRTRSSMSPFDPSLSQGETRPASLTSTTSCSSCRRSGTRRTWIRIRVTGISSLGGRGRTTPCSSSSRPHVACSCQRRGKRTPSCYRHPWAWGRVRGSTHCRLPVPR